jgi:hypothetical protein
MTRAQQKFIATLIAERDIPEERQAYLAGMFDGSMYTSSETASDLIEELDAYPKKKNSNGMIRCKMWSGTHSWLDTMKKEVFEQMRKDLDEHNRTRPNQQAVFLIDGKEIALSAIAEMT